MPLTTNTLTPTGGEISPISRAMTIRTPNQIMLMPSGLDDRLDQWHGQDEDRESVHEHAEHDEYGKERNDHLENR